MKKRRFAIGSGMLLTVLLVTTLAIRAVAATEPRDIQTIEATVGSFAYPDITVEAGKPARINFKVAAADLNACNGEIVIPEWNINQKLSVGDNFVEFTPTESGTYSYSCWMNMLRANINVIEQGSGDTGATTPDVGANGNIACPMMNAGSPGGFDGPSGFGGAGGCH